MGLDESYDNIFSTLTETMLNETVILEDAKALKLSHECRITRRNFFELSSLPSVNMNQVTVGLASSNEKPKNVQNTHNVADTSGHFKQLNLIGHSDYGNTSQYGSNNSSQITTIKAIINMILAPEAVDMVEEEDDHSANCVAKWGI